MGSADDGESNDLKTINTVTPISKIALPLVGNMTSPV